jgi:hypothetical protein
MSALRCKYTHPSLFAGSYSAVSQIRVVAPRINVRHSDLSVDRSIRTVGHSHRSESDRVMFKEQLTSQCFCREEKNTENIKSVLGGQLFADFRLSRGGLET